jgi:hypothetical protein
VSEASAERWASSSNPRWRWSPSAGAASTSASSTLPILLIASVRIALRSSCASTCAAVAAAAEWRTCTNPPANAGQAEELGTVTDVTLHGDETLKLLGVALRSAMPLEDHKKSKELRRLIVQLGRRQREFEKPKDPPRFEPH